MTKNAGPQDRGPEMMQKGSEMMDKMMGSGFNPMEMCRQMTTAVTRAAEMGSYATPEVRALFEDWVNEVEKEIMDFVAGNNPTDPQAIAEKLHISEESAIFFVSRLAGRKKIKITGIRPVNPPAAAGNRETPAEQQGVEEKECST